MKLQTDSSVIPKEPLLQLNLFIILKVKKKWLEDLVEDLEDSKYLPKNTGNESSSDIGNYEDNVLSTTALIMNLLILADIITNIFAIDQIFFNLEI